MSQVEETKTDEIKTEDSKAAKGKAPKAGNADGRIKILISSDSGPGGKDDVFVGADGRAFLIKRDTEVEVPSVVMACLDLAVVTEFETDANGKLTGNVREVPRYNVKVIDK